MNLKEFIEAYPRAPRELLQDSLASGILHDAVKIGSTLDDSVSFLIWVSKDSESELDDQMRKVAFRTLIQKALPILPSSDSKSRILASRMCLEFFSTCSWPYSYLINNPDALIVQGFLDRCFMEWWNKPSGKVDAPVSRSVLAKTLVNTESWDILLKALFKESIPELYYMIRSGVKGALLAPSSPFPDLCLNGLSLKDFRNILRMIIWSKRNCLNPKRPIYQATNVMLDLLVQIYGDQVVKGIPVAR
jgi:hypothetical protein